MVNKEKQKLRALLAFKSKHVNRLTRQHTQLVRREDDTHIYEDIIFVGKVVGTFEYDKVAQILTVKDNAVSDI